MFYTETQYRIAGNFWGRKLCEFRSFVAIRESFLCEIWGMAFFGAAKASNSQKFIHENCIFHQFAKIFSLESFPLYGMKEKSEKSAVARD